MDTRTGTYTCVLEGVRTVLSLGGLLGTLVPPTFTFGRSLHDDTHGRATVSEEPGPVWTGVVGSVRPSLDTLCSGERWTVVPDGPPVTCPPLHWTEVEIGGRTRTGVEVKTETSQYRGWG